MMQLSVESETTLSWRVVGPSTEPFLAINVLCYVLPFILRRPLCFLVICGSCLFYVFARVHQKYPNFASPTFN